MHGVIPGASEERQHQHGGSGQGRGGDADEAAKVEARKDTAAEQEGEDGQGVVQGHLLEGHGGDEEDGGPEVAVGKHAGHGGQDEAEHDGVVLEVNVVDKDDGRLHQDGDEGDRGRPGGHAGQAAVAAHKDDGGGYVDEVLGHEHGGAHEDLEGGIVQAARDVELEPGRVDEGADAAAQPAVVGRQGRVVEAPPLQVMEVPLRDGQPGCDLHPVSLGLVVAEHGRLLEACAGWSAEARPPAMDVATHPNTPRGRLPSGRGRPP